MVPREPGVLIAGTATTAGGATGAGVEAETVVVGAVGARVVVVVVMVVVELLLLLMLLLLCCGAGSSSCGQTGRCYQWPCLCSSCHCCVWCRQINPRRICPLRQARGAEHGNIGEGHRSSVRRERRGGVLEILSGWGGLVLFIFYFYLYFFILYSLFFIF